MMRILFIFLITFMLSSVYGQNYSSINKFYVIEPNNEQTLQIVEEPIKSGQGFCCAIKTNLLFDLLTMINFEVEVPIKQHWSVAGELIFPWWTMDNHQADSKRNRLQLLNGNLEGRYWLGDRTNSLPLTGWFAGLYVGTATYDFEYHAKGRQGDALFVAGVSGGYAHPINKARNLRLEYSLGVGYMTTFYHYYVAEFCSNNCWHAVEKRSGRYKWYGPTRAKVSLSWLFDCKVKR